MKERTRAEPEAKEALTLADIEVCKCGRVMIVGEDDDYDTLGSKSGVCCPDCGNEKFETVQDIIDRQAAEIERLKRTLNKAEVALLKGQKSSELMDEIHNLLKENQ